MEGKEVSAKWLTTPGFIHPSLPGAPQVECRNRRGPMKRGRKVTGLVFTAGGSHLLVSTNDSRCRLLNLDDYSTTFKCVADHFLSTCS